MRKIKFKVILPAVYILILLSGLILRNTPLNYCKNPDVYKIACMGIVDVGLILIHLPGFILMGIIQWLFPGVLFGPIFTTFLHLPAVSIGIIFSGTLALFMAVGLTLNRLLKERDES